MKKNAIAGHRFASWEAFEAHGKSETYLKDDREYQAFLVDRIKDSWELEIRHGVGVDRHVQGGVLSWIKQIDPSLPAY